MGNEPVLAGSGWAGEKYYASACRSLRPCLWKWRVPCLARLGQVGAMKAFLNILEGGMVSRMILLTALFHSHRSGLSTAC